MAIHDAGMFTVKGINRLKILQGYGNGLKTLGFRLLNYMEERISTKLSCVVQDTDWCTASKMKLSR